MASKYWEGQIQATRDKSQVRGDQLANQLDNSEGGYQSLQDTYNQDVGSALSDLRETPGYTDQEAQAIQGQQGLDQLGSDYSNDALGSNFLTGNERSEIQGDPYQAYRNFNPGSTEDTIHSTEQNYNQAMAADRGAVTNAVDQHANALTDQSAYDQTLDNVQNVTAQRTYGAIDPAKLGLSSDYQQNYNFTPQDQQDIVTAAGRTVGNKGQADDDAAMRQAIADGNTSPAALAAIKERNDINAGAEAADAMTDARIKAKQEALNVTQQKEQTRLGAEQDISSRGMQAAQSLGQLADTATQQKEQTRQQALQYLTGQQENAAEFNTGQDANFQQYAGNEALGANEYEQNTATGLLQGAEQQSSNRAATLAGNRQQTNEANQSNQFNRGLTVNDQESQRAGTVANQRISGRNTYLQGAAGQQAQAQQGAQTAAGQQISEYGQEYGLANQANQSAANYSQWQQSQPSVFGQIAGGVLGAAAAFEDGGVAGGDGPDPLDNLSTLTGPSGPDAMGLSGQNAATASPSFWQKLTAGVNRYRNSIPNANPGPNAPGQDPRQQQNNGSSGGFFGGFNQGMQAGSAAGKAVNTLISGSNDSGAAYADGGVSSPTGMLSYLKDQTGEGVKGLSNSGDPSEDDATTATFRGLGNAGRAAFMGGAMEDGDPGATGETALVGENGPEMVMEPNDPDTAQLVTKPTIAKLGNRGKKEIVVPLSHRKTANVRPSAALEGIKSYRSRAMSHMPVRRFDDGGVAQPWQQQPTHLSGMDALAQGLQGEQFGGQMPAGSGVQPAQSQGNPGGQSTVQFGGQLPRQFGGQPMGRYPATGQSSSSQPMRPQGQQMMPQHAPAGQQQQPQPQMMADGGVAGMKTRYRRPTGPMGPHGPIRPLIPLKPSQTFR